MGDYEKYGFSDVVAKPYDIVELSHVLDGVLSGSKQTACEPAQ